MDGKTARGASSPAKPALHIPDPLSTTSAATSSSHIVIEFVCWDALELTLRQRDCECGSFSRSELIYRGQSPRREPYKARAPAALRHLLTSFNNHLTILLNFDNPFFGSYITQRLLQLSRDPQEVVNRSAGPPSVISGVAGRPRAATQHLPSRL
ncbi:unnamed protein product [Pieris brassicae]|uniref:Uncharacterized protein n=1 Tax=Pieris brassicae TaxID=7116 RepID=A0A9P0TBZ3_PIEBR|nr:unnamed protein product [Pieris brassicae]